MSEAKESGMRASVDRLEKMLGSMQLSVLNVTERTNRIRVENNRLNLVIRSFFKNSFSGVLKTEDRF